MRSWRRGAGWGRKGGIPRVVRPLSPLPSYWGHGPCNSSVSPWLGTRGWHPQSRVPCPPLPTRGGHSPPSGRAHCPSQGVCHQPCTPHCAGGPCCQPPGCHPGGNVGPTEAPATGLGWLVCSSRAGITGLRLCKPPLKANRAQAVAALSRMAGDRTSRLCSLLPAPFPRPANGFSLGVTLPSLSPSSGPCKLPQRCCSS